MDMQIKLKHKRADSDRIGGMVDGRGLGSAIANAVLSVGLALFAFCCFIPLWHVAMASLSDGIRLLAHEGVLWLPVGGFNPQGYRLLFRDASIMKGYANTLLYVCGACGAGLGLNILGGYVLSRKSRLRSLLTAMVTFTMLFSGGLVPNYMVVRSLGFVGTRWSLLIPGCTNAFFVVLMMNAFRGVPEATVESARIDGAGHVRVMAQIMLPQARSLMTVTILNSVIMQWNAWFNASIYVTNKRDLWPLQLWIKQIVADNASILQAANPDYNRWLIQYCVIIAATLPVLAAFPFFQEKLEKGMLIGGVKE
jgi:putative aldouronate transport system permease protein